jgi:hypothetical protein
MLPDVFNEAGARVKSKVFLLLAGVLAAEWWLRRNRGLP